MKTTLTVSLSMEHDAVASYLRHADNLEAEAKNLLKAVEQCLTESSRRMLTAKAVLLEVRASRYRHKAKQMQKPHSGE